MSDDCVRADGKSSACPVSVLSQKKVLTRIHYYGSICVQLHYASSIERKIHMENKLFDSELKVMGVLWREGDTTAKHISDVLGQEIGWNINTTYTIIKRCIKKGAIQRLEPNFLCHALVAREAVQEAETDELLDKLFDGAADKLFASLLGRKKLSAGEIARLKEMVSSLEGE